MTEQQPITSDVPLGMVEEENPYRKEFLERIKAAHEASKPKELEHINCIENPALISEKIAVNATIASTSISYVVPKLIHAKITDKDAQRTDSILYEVKPANPLNIEMVDVTHETKRKRIAQTLKAVFNCPVSLGEEKEYRSIYLVRVRPPIFSLKMDLVQNKIVDDKGYEYKCFDLYIASDKQLALQPSTLIHIEGIPLSHPKTQKTTLLAYNVSFPEDSAAFDVEKLNQLRQEFAGKNVSERLAWILDNFEAYSCIKGRRNIAQAGLMAYFTPLYVVFRGEVRNGWGNIGIIGDTTTGKSETIKKISSLLNAGMVISAESASIVGLTGAAMQSEKGSWFIDWGFLPLNDRKLIALDGMHKISKSAIASMAEAERDGKITIVKAGKATTTARTRQIKIFNPLDEESRNFSTKSLAEFLYPCQAFRTVLDEISIARLDLGVTSDARDVTAEQINSKEKTKYNDKLMLLAESLKFVWGNTTKIEWSEQAELTLLDKATELQNQFYYREIPLASSDLKWKLARLSVAVAGLTLSTVDYKTLYVTEDHVNAVVDFLSTEYQKIGLAILAQEERYEKLTLEDVKEILDHIQAQLYQHPIDNIPEILKFIARKTHVTTAEVKTQFNLSDKNELRPLFAALQNEGLITNKKGFYATAKLNEMVTLTKNFAVLAEVAGLKTKPPTPNNSNDDTINKEKSKEEQKQQQPDNPLIPEKIGGGFNSKQGKDGNSGKAVTCDDCNKTLCLHPNPSKIKDKDKTMASKCPEFRPFVVITENLEEEQ
jgi:hypothetical protein